MPDPVTAAPTTGLAGDQRAVVEGWLPGFRVEREHSWGLTSTIVRAWDLPSAPALEHAFVSGDGSDPREPAAWHRHPLREAVSTAAWAHQVGDEAFERQGPRMVHKALARTEVL